MFHLLFLHSVSHSVSQLCAYMLPHPQYAIPQASGVVTLRARTERSALSYIVDPWSSFHRYLMARLFPLHPNSLLVHPPSPPFLSAICWGHSMRSGGASSFAAAGVPPAAIGRWADLAAIHSQTSLLTSNASLSWPPNS